MLCSMRHLEIHVIETEQDVDLALQSGLLSLDRLDSTECADCALPVGHASTDGFEPFAVVIDENDFDWAVCVECASPVTDGVPIEDTESLELLMDLEDLDEDLEKF